MSGPSAEGAQRGVPAVRRRHVFYVSGFDPKGPAHYHRLYGEQAVLAGRVGGYQVEVGKRRKLGEHGAGWSVAYRASSASDASTQGATPAGALASPATRPTGSGDAAHDPVVQTEFEFLRWDDIVRDHWPRNPAVLAWDLVVTTMLYMRTGALWTMFKLAWPPVVALVVPFLILLALVSAVPLAGLVGWTAAGHSGSIALGVVAGAGLFAAAFAGAVWAERVLNMQWLLRSYAFTGRQGTRGWPALEARLDYFAQRIVERAKGAGNAGAASPEPSQANGEGSGTGGSGETAADAACDELLIVAHSSGSMMATAALARALTLDPQLASRGPPLALLTLGQWSPLLSSLPSATAFRAELDRLAREPDLDWVDFTSPPDGCCFALTNPILAAGLPPPRPNHPRLLSPRFAALFSPSAYAQIKRDRFRLHFQYLMANELPGDYDYTAITAGPVTLGQRFADQPSVDDFTQFRAFG